MLLNKRILKIAGCVTAAVVAPTVVIGGYFLIGSSDKYRGFSTNPLSDSVSAMVNSYIGAVQQGAQTVITPGFNHAVPINSAYSQYNDTLKDIGFMLLDSSVAANSPAAANTWNIAYRTDLGSIQVGVAAAYFLNYYQSTFLSNGGDDNSLTYAMWGGLPYSSVTSFMGGFALGVEWANTNLDGKIINNNTYKKVFRLGDDKSPAKKYADLTNGFGPSDGQGSMLQIISDKPDILMPVAGPQVWTASNLIASVGTKTVLVGVDSAVEDDPRNPSLSFKATDGSNIGNGKRVQFSSLKNLARSVETALNIINNGNIVPAINPADPKQYTNFSETGSENEKGGYGTTAVGDSTNGCVGISDIGRNYFDKALALARETSPILIDPSLDPLNSEPAVLKYIGYNGIYDYAFGGFGLVEKFSHNNITGKPNFKRTGFVTKGDNTVKTKFKIILSSANSILMDSSFSQSCYVGLYNYLKLQGIDIPPAAGSK